MTEMSVTVVAIQKLVPRYDKCLSSGDEYVKNSLTLAVSVPINHFIRLGFVSVNGPEKYSLWMRYVPMIGREESNLQ